MAPILKSDDQIKEFIDSKEVLSINELAQFMYSSWKRGKGISGTRIEKYWYYVLKTKNWAKLKKYIDEKIKTGNFKKENYDKYKDIYMSDVRIRTCGTRRAHRLLNQIYNFKLARSVILNYNKRIHDDILK